MPFKNFIYSLNKLHPETVPEFYIIILIVQHILCMEHSSGTVALMVIFFGDHRATDSPIFKLVNSGTVSGCNLFKEYMKFLNRLYNIT
jgi:hypothetical protein